MNLRDYGYIWEGQGFDPGVPPSVFGVGDGAEYFKMNKAVFLFHPNDELSLSRLSNCNEVVCDISKWKTRSLEPIKGVFSNAVEIYIDGSPETVMAEAKKVVELKKRFPNIKGVIHDDMIGLCNTYNLKADEYKQIYDIVSNAGLDMWSVVYSHEFNVIEEKWKDFKRYMDIVHFWVWKSEDLFNLDEYMEKCKEHFPDKPINLGVYLRDYHYRRPVPQDRLIYEMSKIKEYIQKGVISGFSILATVTMDTNMEGVQSIIDFLDRE